MCTQTDATNNDTGFGPNVHVSSHPVLSHKITILRSSSTLPGAFRSVMREVTYHLGYEATSGLKTRPVAVSVPVGNDYVSIEGTKLADRVALIPILRSGLGMTDSMLELLPNAGVHHIGMYKNSLSMPVQYYNRLPRTCAADVAYVLDPVIASGGTTMSVISILKKWGVPKIHLVSVLASREGLTKIIEAYPDVDVTVGTIDEELKEGLVLPGLGDSGDRLFGTYQLDDDESLLHPSKRTKAEGADIPAGKRQRSESIAE